MSVICVRRQSGWPLARLAALVVFLWEQLAQGALAFAGFDVELFAFFWA